MNNRAARTITELLGGVPISTVMLLSIAAGSTTMRCCANTAVNQIS